MSSLVEHRLGRVELSPHGPVVAGSIGTWTLTLTVGSYGIDEGGTIKLTQRYASDWTPQFEQPSELNYSTVRTNGEAKLAVRYDKKAHERPYMKCVVIDVYDGSLAPGDTVTIVLGDTTGGSPGIRAQTFQESRHELIVLVDPTNACKPERLPSSPEFPVVAGEPVELVVIVPTQCVVGRPVNVFVKGQDAWMNPAAAPRGITLTWDGSCPARFEGMQLLLDAPGSGRVLASWQGHEYASNPITATTEPPPYSRYWGDLHAQSDATIGTGSEEEYFTFARDAARLDFASHQGNDFQITDESWQRLNEVVREFHQNGRFVVFPGFEWSANTPAGGDRNVFYLEEGLPIIRCCHWQVPEVAETELTPAHPADAFFARLRQHVPLNKVLVGSHVGGRYADIRRYFDEELGPLVELVSCWGVFEWMLWDAFEKGYIVGVMCNSDGHKGRPGAEGSGAGEFGINNGLTCVLAESLSREAIFRALKARRCYGTTGARIDLEFTVNGQPMGSCIEARGPVQVQATVRGTRPLESLALYQGRQVLHTVQPPEFTNVAHSRRVRASWGGARIRGRGRRVTWDGTLKVEGARIVEVAPYSFDSPADGIRDVADHRVMFQSRTTGDVDGIDLLLDRSDSGSITLETPQGVMTAELAELDGAGVRREFGGLDIHAQLRRYPERTDCLQLELRTSIDSLPSGTTPLFVKAVQVDGQMAWSSPVYITR